MTEKHRPKVCLHRRMIEAQSGANLSALPDYRRQTAGRSEACIGGVL